MPTIPINRPLIPSPTFRNGTTTNPGKRGITKRADSRASDVAAVGAVADAVEAIGTTPAVADSAGEVAVASEAIGVGTREAKGVIAVATGVTGEADTEVNAVIEVATEAAIGVAIGEVDAGEVAAEIAEETGAASVSNRMDMKPQTGLEYRERR